MVGNTHNFHKRAAYSHANRVECTVIYIILLEKYENHRNPPSAQSVLKHTKNKIVWSILRCRGLPKDHENPKIIQIQFISWIRRKKQQKKVLRNAFMGKFVRSKLIFSRGFRQKKKNHQVYEKLWDFTPLRGIHFHHLTWFEYEKMSSVPHLPFYWKNQGSLRHGHHLEDI